MMGFTPVTAALPSIKKLPQLQPITALPCPCHTPVTSPPIHPSTTSAIDTAQEKRSGVLFSINCFPSFLTTTHLYPPAHRHIQRPPPPSSSHKKRKGHQWVFAAFTHPPMSMLFTIQFFIFLAALRWLRLQLNSWWMNKNKSLPSPGPT